MKKICLFSTLLLLAFTSSHLRGTNIHGYEYSLFVQSDSSIYGVTYKYDAAGNRISRTSGPIILNSSNSFNQHVPLLDSLYNENLTTNILSKIRADKY